MCIADKEVRVGRLQDGASTGMEGESPQHQLKGLGGGGRGKK